jgi:glycosyltransferase involved in cell wall biosynthesis
VRLLGVAGANVVCDSDGHRRGKWAPLLSALERHLSFSGIVQPRPPRSRYLAAARRRLQLAEKDTQRFHRWTNEVGRVLDKYDGDYDLIFQLQTLFACGDDFAQRRYVIYADSTLALTLRHYPQGWAADSVDNEALLELEGRVTRSALAVCTLSEWARASMIEDYGCDPDRVVAVGGGATPASVEANGVRGDPRIALFVGMDFERKGGRALVEAWQEVHRRMPDAQLWIAGPRRTGTDSAGVRWLGRLDTNEVARARARAAVFVMPSLFEPWGFVFNEAMASALPCIGTTVCAIPEIIDDQITGILVEPDSPQQLAAALVELLADPNKAERMGNAGLAAYRRTGSWDNVAANIAAVIAATAA